MCAARGASRMGEHVKIVHMPGSSCPPRLLAQVDAIFLETTLKPPPSGLEQDVFRERWLGRYLHGGTDVLLLALPGDNTVAGYLVGALEDPALQERFADNRLLPRALH